MKTDAPLPAESENDNVAAPLNTLSDLLQRPAQGRTQVPERVEGIVLGLLVAIDPSGAASIAIPQFALEDLIAPSLVPLRSEHIGQLLALGFESANPRRPIILGLMHTSAPPSSASNELEIRRDAERVVITAESELELRCGEAVILLTADGHIQLRGGYITSHASASQRIRGGSVQIN